jgi:hypothetical protein
MTDRLLRNLLMQSPLTLCKDGPVNEEWQCTRVIWPCHGIVLGRYRSGLIGDPRD